MLTADPHDSIRTETPIERRFMAADLFLFRRTRGDFTFSLLMVGMVAVLLVFFSSQTGWQARKLPTDMLSYLATQLGIIDPEGRVRAQLPGATAGTLTDVLNLDEVSRVRRFGTAGLNRLWSQWREDDPALELPMYEGRLDPRRWRERG